MTRDDLDFGPSVARAYTDTFERGSVTAWVHFVPVAGGLFGCSRKAPTEAEAIAALREAIVADPYGRHCVAQMNAHQAGLGA
jgi:hypothetical protein